MIDTDLVTSTELGEHAGVQLLLLRIVVFDCLFAQGDLVEGRFVVWFQFTDLYEQSHKEKRWVRADFERKLSDLPCWNHSKHYSVHRQPRNSGHDDRMPWHCLVRFPKPLRTKGRKWNESNALAYAEQLTWNLPLFELPVNCSIWDDTRRC